MRIIVACFLLAYVLPSLCAKGRVAPLAQVSEDFASYMSDYGKVYSSKEEVLSRQQIYFDNVKRIELHNANPHKTYEKGINQFTDMTEEEFLEAFPELPPIPDDVEVEDPIARLGGMAPPDAWDWRTKGAVTAVKNQGQCGVCWAFASTAAAESAYFIQKGTLISLSESQQVICNTHGGSNENAFTYLRTHGAFSEAAFPYECPEKRTGCPSIASAVPSIHNFTILTASNEEALKAGVYAQPVAIGIAASGDFASYRSGVFTGPCPGGRNHAVLIVGYGTDAATRRDYWLIKNSWGPGWGESGYIRIQRNVPNVRDGLCLLATDPSVPHF
jgi:KDEL-tailed cysteine endopeptidase